MAAATSLALTDARDFLRGLAARESAARPAVLVTDPPYALTSGGRGNPDSDHQILGGKFDNKFYNNDGNICSADLDWADWCPLAYDALADCAEAIVMCNDKHVLNAGNALTAAGFKIHNLLYWRKADHGTSVVNRYFRKDTEYAWYVYKGAARTVNPGYRHHGQGFSTPDFITQSRIDYGGDLGVRAHPNEKPVRLMMDWIGALARPGETVIDPFAGSASTAIAAMALGFNFEGAEHIAEIHAAAVDRMTRAARLSPAALLQNYAVTEGFDFTAPTAPSLEAQS